MRPKRFRAATVLAALGALCGCAGPAGDAKKASWYATQAESEAPSIRSLDGKWSAVRVQVGTTDSDFEIWVKSRGGSKAFAILSSVRSVEAFWTESESKALLVLEDAYCSSDSHCLVCEPDSGRIWRPDLKAVADFEATAGQGNEYDHLFSGPMAASPDGRKLLIGVCGHGDRGLKNGIAYVVWTRSGEIIRRYPDPARPPATWWK